MTDKVTIVTTRNSPRGVPGGTGVGTGVLRVPWRPTSFTTGPGLSFFFSGGYTHGMNLSRNVLDQVQLDISSR